MSMYECTCESRPDICPEHTLRPTLEQAARRALELLTRYTSHHPRGDALKCWQCELRDSLEAALLPSAPPERME